MDSDSFLFISSNIQFHAITSASIIAFVIIGILFFISAITSAFEMGFLSIAAFQKKEIEESENPADKKMQEIFANQEQFSATVLIWNSLINVAIIILWLFAFDQMADFSQSPVWCIFFHILCLTVLIILFERIIPKIIIRNKPLNFIQKTVPFLKILEAIVLPLVNLYIYLLGKVTQSSKRKTGDVSVDELSKALKLTSDELTEEKEMLQGIIELYHKTAVEIMTSRMDMADIDVKSNFKEVIRFIIEVGYSRIPVCSGNQDDIRGILYSKDLLPYLNKHDEFRWQSLIRPAFFVPENKKIDDLLEDFRKNKIHLAIVVDEFGGTSGIVTMEDILEEIVGEIDDEYDDEELKYTSLVDGSYIFDAKISLADFFRIAQIDSKLFGNLTDEVDTMAGLILEIKEDFPVENETVSYGNFSFQVLEMDRKRILKVKFTKLQDTQEKTTENESN